MSSNNGSSDGYVRIEIRGGCMAAPVEKSFNSAITIRELKNKLVLLTGVETDFMKVSLFADGICLSPQLETQACLDRSLASFLPSTWENKIHVEVTDLSGNDAMAGGGDSSVPKFELADDAYEKRNESLRKFKKDHNLGRFDPEAELKKKELFEQRESQERELAAKIKLDDRVEVRVVGHPSRRGVVKFIGNTQFKEGIWVGVQLDEPLGKNNGTISGVKYFECSPNYGSFVKPSDVTVGDFPPEGDVDFENME